MRAFVDLCEDRQVIFWVTTDPGLEDVVVDEVLETISGAAAAAEPDGRRGWVRVEAPDLAGLFELATIHHIVEARLEARVTTLDEIRSAVDRAEFPELKDAASFRVTSRREGDHEFDSVAIQRAAGGRLHERYRTPVDLDGFDVEVRVDLTGDRLTAGIQHTRKSLGKRILRARSLRSALKPTVAAAMIRLAGAQRGGGRLIDPLCGTGTIAIEAKRLNPALEVAAADWDPETVGVARRTIENHRLEIELFEADARELGAARPGAFDYILTDPPYGMRQARRTSLSRLYRNLLTSFAGALREGGTVGWVVLKYRVLLAALEGSGLEVVHERVIDLGGIHPRIVLLRRSASLGGRGPELPAED